MLGIPDRPDCPDDRGKDNAVCNMCDEYHECEKEAHRKDECWDDCVFCAEDKRFHDGRTCKLLELDCKYCEVEKMNDDPIDNKIWCSVCFEETEGLTGGICDDCHCEAHTDNKCFTGCPACESRIIKVDCEG